MTDTEVPMKRESQEVTMSTLTSPLKSPSARRNGPRPAAYSVNGAKASLHGLWHPPAEQTGRFIGQTAPHRPQWLALLRRSTSQPSPSFMLQSPNITLHWPIPHLLFTQAAWALARVHTAPHAPQFARSAPRFFSQPLGVILSQSAHGALQAAMPHTAALQEGVALAKLHFMPQAPQLLTSVVI